MWETPPMMSSAITRMIWRHPCSLASQPHLDEAAFSSPVRWGIGLHHPLVLGLCQGQRSLTAVDAT